MITDKWCSGKWSRKDEWLNDGGARGQARLKAKRTQSGVTFYFQYFDSSSQRRFIRLGKYDGAINAADASFNPDADHSFLSVLGARMKAARLSRLYQEGHRDLHDFLKSRHEAKQQEEQQQLQAAQQESEAALKYSLRRLLDLYVAHLQALGKESAKEVHNHFRRGVYEPFPDIAATPAARLTMDDFVKVIGYQIERGHGRGAAQLRSFLRAAYALAVKSRSDPKASAGMREFNLQANPVAQVAALTQFNKTRTRHFDADEAGSVLRKIDAMESGPVRDVLQLLWHLGGQRPKQLVRVRPEDVDLTAKTVLLRDPKGARTQPRLHLLPLTPTSLQILKTAMKHSKPGAALFRLRSDQIGAGLVSTAFKKIADEMLASGELKSPANLRDVRRTCETMMAALKIDKQVRAHIQSHGLGGVQNRHYDMHEYAQEKREALLKWGRHLAALKARKPKGKADRKPG